MNSLSPLKPIIVLSDVGLFLIYPKNNLLFSQNDYFITFYGWGGGRGSGYLQNETVVLLLKGSRDVVVLTTLASHQCDPGLDSRTRRYRVGRVCC